MVFTYIREEEELYNLGGRDCGRAFYCEWRTLAPSTYLSWNPWHLHAQHGAPVPEPRPGSVARHSLESALSICLCTKGTRRRNARVFVLLSSVPYRIAASPAGVPRGRFLHHCVPSVSLPSLSFRPPLTEQGMSERVSLHAETLSFGALSKLCLLKDRILWMRHLGWTSEDLLKTGTENHLG